jgi:hypothetical protein
MSQIPPQDQQPSADATERADHTRRVAPPPPPTQVRPDSRQRRPSTGRAGYRPPPEPAAPPPSAAYPVQPYQPAASRRRRPPRSTPPSESGLYLPWWSLVVMVVVVGVIAFGLLFAFTVISEPTTPGDQAPRVQVITAQPTLSQDFAAENSGADQQQFWPTAIPQAQPSATVALPTFAASPSLPPGKFDIGTTVQVVGVDVNGLNVRSAPGYSGSRLFLALENDTFVVVGGPQTADGLEWWKIQDPDDSARVGWAARNYLMGVSQ